MLKKLGIFLTILILSCSSVNLGQQILDAVNKKISDNDCVGAYDTVKDAYNSQGSNNLIRFAMAQSYACYTGFKFFPALEKIINFSDSFNETYFWKFLVTAFPTSSIEQQQTVGLNAQQSNAALMAMTDKKSLDAVKNTLTTDLYNTQYLDYLDRTQQSNFFGAFMSMPWMAAYLTQYGNPDADGFPTLMLPWIGDGNPLSVMPSPPWPTTGTQVADGCALASGVLHFYDGLDAILLKEDINASIKSKLQNIADALAEGLDAACKSGCKIRCAKGPSGCDACPVALRNPKSCTNDLDNENTCAAIGILTFINSSWKKGG